MARVKRLKPGKAAPRGKLRGKAASSTREPKPRGIDPGNPRYGIANTSRKHSSAVTQSFSRNVPSGQGQLSGKAKRQVQ